MRNSLGLFPVCILRIQIALSYTTRLAEPGYSLNFQDSVILKPVSLPSPYLMTLASSMSSTSHNLRLRYRGLHTVGSQKYSYHPSALATLLSHSAWENNDSSEPILYIEKPLYIFSINMTRRGKEIDPTMRSRTARHEYKFVRFEVICIRSRIRIRVRIRRYKISTNIRVQP
jgi:hypothetical protein